MNNVNSSLVESRIAADICLTRLHLRFFPQFLYEDFSEQDLLTCFRVALSLLVFLDDRESGGSILLYQVKSAGPTRSSGLSYELWNLSKSILDHRFEDSDDVDLELTRFSRKKLDGDYHEIAWRGSTPEGNDAISSYEDERTRFDEDALIREVLSLPMYQASTGFDWHHEANLVLAHLEEKNPKIWRFWALWYEGILEGKPLDWGLQRRIALIDDEIWAPPMVVAEKIEKIEAKFDLENRIEELENEGDGSLAEKYRFGIGGNTPPPDQRIQTEITKTTTLIWADIEDLKAEINKPKPVKSTVAWIIEKLSASLVELVALCGRLAEHALKVAVGTVVATGTANYVLKPELLELVIEAAKKWLATF